ncbi:MAG: hypothetical protein LBT27_00330 [Prevotellaceae bacterium]|jgi:hypothetical protein|nr:hypothetical protein [Prevotellaceae bacterium]
MSKLLNLTDIEIDKLKLHVNEYINTPDKYIIGEVEMNLEISVLCQYLKKNEYQFIDNHTFNLLINQIFDIDMLKSKCLIIEHPKYFYIRIDNNAENSKTAAQETTATHLQALENIVFVKDYNFITVSLPLGKLFDNKDDMLLPVQKEFSTIFHRNKYLFNESRTSLTWLLINDHEFLTILVKIFGYDKEPLINKAILENEL